MKTHASPPIQAVILTSDVTAADRFEVESIFRAARSPHSWATNQRGLRVSLDKESVPSCISDLLRSAGTR